MRLGVLSPALQLTCNLQPWLALPLPPPHVACRRPEKQNPASKVRKHRPTYKNINSIINSAAARSPVNQRMGEVRRRKKKESRINAKEMNKTKTQSGESSRVEGGTSTEEGTLWGTFTGHPLIRIAPFVLVPYAFYLLFYKLTLQRPDLLSSATLGFLDLRPAVGIDDERQLLVVGTISSGTAQVASDLREKLGLEIGHEVSCTYWNFVRDGTISWFHGIRFLERPAKEDMSKSLELICGGGFKKNMGFHPAGYRVPMGKCSYHKKWDGCWKRECYATLLKEWGCAKEGNCEINFRRILHQIRNPLRTIESLVGESCHFSAGNSYRLSTEISFPISLCSSSSQSSFAKEMLMVQFHHLS
mmetsp:Transcript_52041/g.156174  ORF Transcript_52041/g.156174 Transcript_52041/m.156174 type:complete len:359 (-) Transcript_52041:698-1774(-)